MGRRALKLIVRPLSCDGVSQRGSPEVENKALTGQSTTSRKNVAVSPFQVLTLAQIVKRIYELQRNNKGKWQNFLDAVVVKLN